MKYTLSKIELSNWIVNSENRFSTEKLIYRSSISVHPPNMTTFPDSLAWSYRKLVTLPSLTICNRSDKVEKLVVKRATKEPSPLLKIIFTNHFHKPFSQIIFTNNTAETLMNTETHFMLLLLKWVWKLKIARNNPLAISKRNSKSQMMGTVVDQKLLLPMTPPKLWFWCIVQTHLDTMLIF